MVQRRIIPCLLLRDASLVKTVRFDKFNYIGDPINTCRIFNELEVDELAFLDILATRNGCEPNYSILQDIANECFMPLSYGGGIRSVDAAERILQTGFEKIILNSYPFEKPSFLSTLAKLFGSQAIVVAIDVRKNVLAKHVVCRMSGTVKENKDPVAWAQEVESLGAGEILLTSIDREGTWKGFDIELISRVTRAVSIPVIAHGGAGKIAHIENALNNGGASAVALGSMVVYQGKDLGVLVNFPDKNTLAQINGIQ